jgi:hypothetical protein
MFTHDLTDEFLEFDLVTPERSLRIIDEGIARIRDLRSRYVANLGSSTT